MLRYIKLTPSYTYQKILTRSIFIHILYPLSVCMFVLLYLLIQLSPSSDEQEVKWGRGNGVAESSDKPYSTQIKVATELPFYEGQVYVHRK